MLAVTPSPKSQAHPVIVSGVLGIDSSLNLIVMLSIQLEVSLMPNFAVGNGFASN